MKKQKLTEQQIREKMQDAIDTIHKELIDPKLNSGQKANCANALSGLIRSYKELFGVAPEQPVELKSVKSF